ncbi:MAG: hypothetical protein ABW022_11145 [Actinoplanes sp.]
MNLTNMVKSWMLPYILGMSYGIVACAMTLHGGEVAGAIALFWSIALVVISDNV